MNEPQSKRVLSLVTCDEFNKYDNLCATVVLILVRSQRTGLAQGCFTGEVTSIVPWCSLDKETGGYTLIVPAGFEGPELSGASACSSK